MVSTVIRWTLFLLIAIAVGVFARSNNGYVQISTSMIQIETSLNFLILVWIFSFIVFYFLVRILVVTRRLFRKRTPHERPAAKP